MINEIMKEKRHYERIKFGLALVDLFMLGALLSWMAGERRWLVVSGLAVLWGLRKL